MTYDETLLSEAQQTFSASQTGYELGEFNLLDLLDAQRTLVEIKSGHLTALHDYHFALTEVEQLIGQRLDTID